jgi:hypothetical protein
MLTVKKQMAVAAGGIFALLFTVVFSVVASGQQNDSRQSRPKEALGFVSAANFPGEDWLAKVNAAAGSLIQGGTVEVPDSIAGSARTTGTIPSNVTLEFTGSSTFGFCQINIGPFSKIYNNDTLLRMDAANCIGINQTNHAPLQTSDKFLVDGVRIDCNGQPNSTGIYIGGDHGQAALRNVSIVNCTAAGLKLEGAQFGEYSNVSLYRNFVGLKIYSTSTGGGGNSNTFYGLKAVGGTVGVVIAANSGYGMGSDYFVNPSLLDNSTTAMAVFGNKWASDIHWYGGAPEYTAKRGTPETATVNVDGRVVKRATVYANLARVYLTDVEIGEAQVNPFARAENNSDIILSNVAGYGNTGGYLVSADESSTTTIEGHLDSAGSIDNAVAYPSVMKGGPFRISGAPIMALNPLIPNAYRGNAKAPALADSGGAKSSPSNNDARLGAVSSVTHSAGPGNQQSNRANFGNIISTPVASNSNVLVSILAKSSVDCAYVMQAYGDGRTAVHAHLLAGQWKRFVIFKPNLQPRGDFVLVGFPEDSSGPTVSFTALEVLAEPADSWNSSGYAGVVLTTGAVNPNDGNR